MEFGQACQQCDQVGRIFTYWVMVYFEQFFSKITEVAHILGATFSHG
jgi:hypothetical protein